MFMALFYVIFTMPNRVIFVSFQAEKNVCLTKKVEELTEDLLKLESKNRSLVAELEQAKKTEENSAKTYEDGLKVVLCWSR